MAGTAVEEILSEIKRVSEGKANKEELGRLQNELMQAIENRDKELNQKMGDFETQFETKMAKMVEDISGAFTRVNLKANNGMGSEHNEKHGKSFGEFLKHVKVRSSEIKDLAETTGGSGGYLVPEVWSREILRVELESSLVRSCGARVIPMTSPILKIPALNMSSNAAGSIYGGVAAYWTDENASLTESEPNFKRVTLEPKKLIGYVEDSNELEADSIVSLGGLLQQMFGEVLAFEEDYAFMRGTGVGQPLGVLSAPCRVTVSRNTASAVVTIDVIEMIARFKGNMQRATWCTNQTSLPSLYRLRDENNNYIWHPGTDGSIAKGVPGTLYGLPVRITEKLPAVGTEGDLCLCDFGYYVIGDRQGLRVEESTHFKFQNDQKAMRMIKRVDGQPWLDAAITPRAGSTLSPFVILS